MAPSFLADPLLSKYHDSVRLSYELPHRVYDAKLYPVRSSNGSSIIVYGHDGGLTVIWRGGRRLKASHSHSTRQNKQQKPSKPGVITIDSDDEAPQATSSSRAKLYENEEEEEDPTKPFEPMVATHEIELKSSVYGIAVAPLPSDSTVRSTVPNVFNKRIVIAASCSDNTIQLLSLPLDPTTTHKSTVAYGEQKLPDHVHRVEVTSSTTHSVVPRGVALSYTNATHNALVEDEDTDMAEDGKASKPSRDAWQLLVASHSWGAGGLLAVSRLHFHCNDPGNAPFKDTSCSTDTINLSNMGTALSFNPARYPSTRHSRLLLADVSGAVRLFDTAAPRKTIDGRRLGSRDGTRSMPLCTQLLTTFYAPYSSNTTASLNTPRLKLLDVAWALHGKCIMALLKNGHWGIWDFIEAGPQITEKHKSLGPQSVPGTGLTEFSLEGQLPTPGKVGLDESSNGAGSMNKAAASAPSTLAPMTPKTRKTREESLFTSSSGGLKPNRLMKGKVSVLSYSGRDAHDESVVMSYGQEFFLLPRLMASWKQAQDAQKASGAISGQATVHAPNMQHVSSMSTLGEMVTGISQFQSRSSNHPPVFPRDVMVVAEHRLVVWCPDKPQPKPAAKQQRALSRQQPTEEEQAIQRVDQDRLKSGNLDLGGMDRMLASMGGGRRSLGNEAQSGSPLARKGRAGTGLFAG